MFILVTGGAASGKSATAEKLACALGKKRLYIATMPPSDSESINRIKKHKEQRKTGAFDTLEWYDSFRGISISGKYDAVLVECVSNLLANELYGENGARGECAESIMGGFRRLMTSADTVLAVTNEVFSDGRTYDASTAEYIRKLGEINCLLAGNADVIIEAVCGIPLMKKGSLPRGVEI